jgi:hypothetical protein
MAAGTSTVNTTGILQDLRVTDAPKRAVRARLWSEKIGEGSGVHVGPGRHAFSLLCCLACQRGLVSCAT